MTPIRCCHHDVCYMINKGNPCINDNPCEIPCIFDSRKAINFSRCPSVVLTPTIATHYQQRSQDTGKTVQQLVLADLTALMKKRTAREEKRVFKEIEYERL